MDEIFPIGAGLLLGTIFAIGWGWIQEWWKRSGLVVAMGVSATVLSGEYQESWGFVLVDIVEVAVVTWICFCLTRYLRRFVGGPSVSFSGGRRP